MRPGPVGLDQRAGVAIDQSLSAGCHASTRASALDERSAGRSPKDYPEREFVLTEGEHHSFGADLVG